MFLEHIGRYFKLENIAKYVNILFLSKLKKVKKKLCQEIYP